MAGDWPASFRVARLFRKTSAKGNAYFTGRWGGARISLVKSKEIADDGGEIWALMLSEAPAPREAGDAPARREHANQSENPPRARSEAPARSAVDTEIPF